MKYEHLGKTFNEVFRHYNATVNNINIHYVKGGSGEPLVLLHGYPQTWYAFRYILPELARHFTLIIPDLRGLGDSDIPAGGYDTATVADDIFLLVTGLGYDKINLVGHDFGGNVAYAYAASHRKSVKKMAILDIGFLNFNLANSPLLPQETKSLWWFPFQMVPGLPELLIAGREAVYLNWFFQNSSYIKNAITEQDLQEYVRCYSEPGGLAAGFNYYRALFDDMRFNEEQSKIKLKIPVLILGGEFSFGARAADPWKLAAENVQGLVIKNAGHYLLEEQPQLTLNALLPFLLTP